MAPTRLKSTQGSTRSSYHFDPARPRGVRSIEPGTAGLRALIAAASIAATMGGWSVLAFGDTQAQAQAQAQAAQDAQAQYDASVLASQQSSPSVSFPEIPAVPTLVPAPAPGAAQTAGNDTQQAAASAQQPASTPTPAAQKAAPQQQQQPALRSVTVPNPSAQRPAPFTRSRSSR